jgi:hypothetical protein
LILVPFPFLLLLHLSFSACPSTHRVVICMRSTSRSELCRGFDRQDGQLGLWESCTQEMMMMMMLLRVGFSREILCMISQYTKRSATTPAPLSQPFMFVVMIRHDVRQSRNAYKKTIAKQIRRYATSPETSPNPNSLVYTQTTNLPNSLSLQNPSTRPSNPSPLAANRKVKRSSIRTEHEKKTRVPATQPATIRRGERTKSLCAHAPTLVSDFSNACGRVLVVMR